MNVALLQRLYGRSSAELLAELHGAALNLPGVLDQIGHLVADGDSLALERLERLAERFSGLNRLALQARVALVNERHSDPEAA
jgi:hypothetical protein